MSGPMTRAAGAPAELSDEDRDRAQLYGIVAALFAAPPLRPLLDALRPAVGIAEPITPMVAAWNALCTAATRDLSAWSDAYHALFLGVGKPDVLPFASFWIAGALHERPLAELRGHLSALGLARADHVTETEDHIAAVCGAMRMLITRGDPRQDAFFARYVAKWVPAFCDAVVAHPKAGPYASVAGLLRTFVDVEAEAVSIDDATASSPL